MRWRAAVVVSCVSATTIRRSVPDERVRGAKGDDAAFAYAFDTRSDFFDFVGIQIAAGLEDDVLHAAGDEEFALGSVGAIAGAEPARLGPSGKKSARWLLRCGNSRASWKARETRARLLRGLRLRWPAAFAMRTSCPGSDRPTETNESTAESFSADSAETGTARPSRSKMSRDTRSTRGSRPSGGIVTAREDSANPYTGRSASLRKP